MKRTKVLFIITKSNMGGAQRYVYELATGLSPEIYEVVVACGGDGLLIQKLEHAGIRTVRIKSFARDINIREELRSLRELYTLMRTERPDVVHVNSSKAGGSGAFIARLCAVKRIIFTAHGWPFYEPRGYAWRTLAWFFSYITTLLAHTVIVVSKHDLRGARMWGLTHKLVYIPTAVPHFQLEDRDQARAALFSDTTITRHASALWLVSTGELNHNKNVDLIVKAVARASRETTHTFFLTIMGEGELHDALRTLTHTLGIEDRVAFTGYIPDARQFLKAFDIFLIPSEKEGLPYGLLEAGKAGCAVIGSAVGGIPEIIIPNHTGILIPPGDVDALTRALISLAHAPETRTAYAQALTHAINTHMSLEGLIAKTTALYHTNGSRTA